MQVIIVYLIAYGSAVGLLLGWRLSQYLTTQARKRVFSTFTKWAVYSVVTRRLDGSSDVTIVAGFVILLLVVANIVGSTVFIQTRTELSLRLAKLSVTNLAILYLGGRSNILLDKVFRLFHTEQQLMHRWIGRITVIEGLIHGVFEISQLRSAIKPIDLSLFVVSSTIAATSIVFVRRRMHELFAKTHSTLAVGIIVLLLLHVRVLNTYMFVCISIAASIFVLQKTTWLLHFVYRNFGSGPTTKATITPGEISTIELNTKRPWVVVPGQFIYLSLPRLRRFGLGFWESHPFMIAWVPEQEKGQASTIILLVQGHRGFTRRLKNANTEISALIDGPYGGLDAESFTKHDKILLMSDGIGIAAHLYAAQYLLRSHDQKTARVRRLTLVWVVGSQDQMRVIEEYLFSLHDMDQERKILTIFCYLPDRSASPSTRKAVTDGPQGPRIMSLVDKLDMPWFLEKEWGAEAGNMLVSVCGSPMFEQRARKVIRSSSHEIDFRGSVFQPSNS